MAYLSVVASFGFDTMPPDRMLPRFARLGCRGAQFHRSPQFTGDPADVRRFAEGEALPFHSIHGVFGPEYDPSSLDEDVRQRSVQAYRHEAVLARKLGARMIVVHPSIATDDGRGSDDRRAALVRSMQELDRIAEQTGVVMLLENLPATYGWGSDPAALAELIREQDLPRVRMCFDTGHAHMTGSVLESLRACEGVIDCVHVHDNDARQDSHELPGDGTIDWPTLGPALAKLPEDVPLALEIFPTPEQLQERLVHGYGPTLAEWFAA